MKFSTRNTTSTSYAYRFSRNTCSWKGQLEKTEKLKSFSYVEKFEVSKIPFKLENTNRSLKVFNAEWNNQKVSNFGSNFLT